MIRNVEINDLEDVFKLLNELYENKIEYSICLYILLLFLFAQNFDNRYLLYQRTSFCIFRNYFTLFIIPILTCFLCKFMV